MVSTSTGMTEANRRFWDVLQEIHLCFAAATTALWRELRAGESAPAIVHCNDLNTLLAGVLAKRAFGCRLVYDAHEFWPYSQPNAGWYYSPFFRFYERSLIGQCDTVVTVNKPGILNHRYCCPNKLSQYLQGGLMVLCNELPYVKHVVSEACAGLAFDTRDEAGMVEVIRRAANDAALRERCGRNGRAYARRAFNWQQFYPVLEAAYLGRTADGQPS